MSLKTLFSAGLLLGSHLWQAQAYPVDPPAKADPKTVSDCSNWIIAASGDRCDAIASQYGISASDFENVYNPSVGTSCKLTAGQTYCVERNFGIPNEPTTTKTTSGPGATTTGNGVSTPAPTQPGMIDSCNKFYKTKSGDTCGKVLAANGISLADFYAWNKGVGDNCQSLWLDTNYCVGIIGGATATKPPGTTSTSTTAGNGVATPKPTQDGMTPQCNKFYLTKGGDTCGAISKANGISLADFYDWNSGLGGTCDALWADTYYCVGIIGGSTTKPTSPTKTSSPPTTTSKGNGIATPTPYMPGMVENCDKFYLVKSGEGCAAIAKKSNITLKQFYAWNTGVGDACELMWADAYVCVHAK